MKKREKEKKEKERESVCVCERERDRERKYDRSKKQTSILDFLSNFLKAVHHGPAGTHFSDKVVWDFLTLGRIKEFVCWYLTVPSIAQKK